MKLKARIYVTQRENDKFFKQKLPTYRDGFCYITRTVTVAVDPTGVYSEEGEYGHIVAGNKNIPVIRTGRPGDYEIR
jgi:hypothetical protein